MRRFSDRIQAGRMLGEALSAYRGRADVLVLGLPRGGVPVAREVADALGSPVDVLVVRKLGVPRYPELAFGALGPDGVVVLNEDVFQGVRIREAELRAVIAREQAELERREQAYRRRPFPDVRERTVIVVDDGLATGATMRAAVQTLRKMEARRVVVAVPVGSWQSLAVLRQEADEVVCLQVPPELVAIGYWYEDFGQTTDEEVRSALAAG